MAVTKLFIFTSSYPYSQAKEDTFLNPELKVLHNHFKITVIPLNAGGYLHSLERGIDLNDGFAKKYKISKKTAILNAIPLLFTKFLWVELFRNYKILTKVTVFKNFLINSLQRKLLLKWISNELFLNNARGDVILYSYWFDGYTSALIDYKKRSRNRIKVITRAHRGDLYAEERRSGYIPFRQEALSSIDRVFLISRHGHEYLKNAYPRRADKFKISHLGIMDRKITSKKSTDGVIRIVSCSFVSPVKRVDKIFMSILELASLTPKNIEWFHIGGGPGLDEINSLVELNIKSNLQTHLLGNQPNEKIFEFYVKQPIDFFLMLSESEGIPVAMMEAMSVGLPIITTAVGGIPEIIDNEINGILFDVNVENKIIAQSILSIANCPDRLDKMKIETRKKWLATSNAMQCFNSFASDISEISN